MIEFAAYSEFAEIPPNAQALAKKYRTINPFVCDLWLQNFEQHLVKPSEEVLYLVAHDGKKVSALFAFLIYYKSKLKIKKMRTMANFYTTFYSPIFRDDARIDELAFELAQYINKQLSEVTVIEYEPLRDGDLFERVSANCHENFGYSVGRYPCHLNCFELVADDTFETYWSRRPSRLRNTLKRKSKALAKAHDFDIEIIADAERISVGYDKFQLVYGESWKSAESSPQFIHSMIIDLAKIERARLGILSVDGDPAAAQIWFRIGEDWAVFKLAYRERYKAFSVGTILFAAMIEDFFASGTIKHLDFLSGDDAYKRDWMSQSRTHYGIEMINRRQLAGRAIDLKRKFSRSSRQSDNLGRLAADSAPMV